MNEVTFGTTCGIKSLNEWSRVDSARASAGCNAVKDGNLEVARIRSSADAEFGLGGAIVEGSADYTSYSYGDQAGSVDVGKANVNGGLGFGAGGGKAKVNVGVDLVEARAKIGRNQEVRTNLGLNVNTGGEFGVDGVDVSVAGLGFSIGRQTGINTPFGSIKFKLW